MYFSQCNGKYAKDTIIGTIIQRVLPNILVYSDQLFGAACYIHLYLIMIAVNNCNKLNKIIILTEALQKI